MTTIERTSVILGAENDNFHVNGLVHCDHAQPVQAAVTLDSTAVRGLDTALHLVDSAPGKKIEPLGVYYSKEAGAYGGGAAITLRFGSGHVVATIPLADITSASAEAGWADRANQSGTPESQAAPSDSVQILTGTAFTGNGGDLAITLIYLEVE